MARIVSRALHKTVRAYQSAGDLLDDLNHLKQEMMIAESKSHDSQAERLKTGVKSYRWATVVAVAALIVAGLAFGLYRLISQPQPGAKVAGPDPRVVPFTSFPGGESEPAFSPDGNRIAFVWRGPKDDNADIYVKQPGAEGLQRLTTDPADDTGPAWSPDARYIAFLRRSSTGSGIYSVPALGGGERKLAEVFNDSGRSHFTHWSRNQNPNWSPDGQSLAIVAKARRRAVHPFSRHETRHKRRYHAACDSYGDTRPAFSPAGSYGLRRVRAWVADGYLAAAGGSRRLTFRNSRSGVDRTPDTGKSFSRGRYGRHGGCGESLRPRHARRLVLRQMVLDPAIRWQSALG